MDSPSTPPKTEQVFEIKDSSLICCACECIPGTHLCFWNCPIFDNEKICVECCHLDTLQSSVADTFSKKLGKTITAEEIKRICTSCGRNYQNAEVLPPPEIYSQESPKI